MNPTPTPTRPARTIDQRLALLRDVLPMRAMLALCTLRADARVAEFLQQWTEALSQRGIRFAGRGRRNLQIREPRAFASFIDENLARAQPLQ